MPDPPAAAVSESLQLSLQSLVKSDLRAMKTDSPCYKTRYSAFAAKYLSGNAE